MKKCKASLALFAIILIIVNKNTSAGYSQEGQYDYTLQIDFSETKLSVIDNNSLKIIKEYPVAVAYFKMELPIIGEVREIIKNPYWYPTQKTIEKYQKKGIKLPTVVPPGDPSNAMGSVKITINFFAPNISKPLVIHGTNTPKSIGKKISRGCIRMYNKDIEELSNIIQYKKTKIIFKE